ncbi:15223_t:CDS:2, partial [Funneliformis caledonium]
MGFPMYKEVDDIITLNGIIKELDSKSYFRVSVDKDEDVYDFKMKILEEQSVQITRDSTKLNDIKDESASIKSILVGKEARSIDKITFHFQNLDENH